MSRVVNVLFVTILLAQNAVALTHAPLLQATMKSLSKDVGEVIAPSKKPNPADVTNDMILAGVTRARTAVYALQLVVDRCGKFVDGALLTDELTPGIQDEPLAKQQELLEKFPGFLLKAKDLVISAEKELQKQYALPVSQRRFTALKAIGGQIDGVMMDAHKLFKPPQQP